MFKIFSDLTKFGIVIFVLLSGMAGYGASYPTEIQFSWSHLLGFIFGLYFLSSGSLALNQVQEYEIDRKMPRTAKRPIAAGKISPQQGLAIAVGCLLIGFVLLSLTSTMAMLVGLASVLFYNLFYTKFWKRKWIFGAIPGAIPGALPVTIGYAANDPNIFNLDSVYLFLVMFFWQMPHFWALAIRYKEDYAKGNIPTLPVSLGTERTLYHVGVYTFAFVITAAAGPLFFHGRWAYMIFVLPLAAKIMQEFFKYFKSKGEKNWFPFFMWVNIAMLIFIFVPVFDKWSFLIFPKL